MAAKAAGWEGAAVAGVISCSLGRGAGTAKDGSSAEWWEEEGGTPPLGLEDDTGEELSSRQGRGGWERRALCTGTGLTPCWKSHCPARVIRISSVPLLLASPLLAHVQRGLEVFASAPGAQEPVGRGHWRRCSKLSLLLLCIDGC